MAESKPIRILYMEDDPGIARLFEKKLKRAGYVVDLARDGEEGLNMYNAGSYDVIAVDHNLPVYDGLEVIRTLAFRGQLPPTIMITGTGNEQIAVEAMKLGAGDYVVKDVEGRFLELLPTVIEQVLRQQQLAEAKQRAEEALKMYSERLEEIVEERTRELREAQEQLVRKEKLAVLGQMAGGVAHELRNPLSVIANALHALYTDIVEEDDAGREALQMIDWAVCESTKIVSDLLDFSRTRGPDRRNTEVSELVAQVLERHPPPEGVNIRIEIHDDVPLIYVDPQHIGLILNNLVTNAYQAMSKGGKLTVSAHAIKTSEVSGKPPRSKWVALSITDTGCGISEEDMKKLFEPLFTTKKEGIGLGLVTSKNLVEANGGSIEVESDGVPGKGSTFTVRLPVTNSVASNQ